MGNCENLKNLPLMDLHEKAGARFCGFAGWSMPLTYPPGVMKEHLHTRAMAGLFDISHMKLIEISGKQAAKLISFLCPLDAGSLNHGQSKYSFLLNETAGIIDDLIITRLGDNRFMIVANAGNAIRDLEHIEAKARDFDISIEPLDRVFLALQGPSSADVLKNAGLGTGSLVFMQGMEPAEHWFMSRSGYTGEDGFEIAAPEADARALVLRLLEDDRCQWIGLAARDSLRLEAGLCLHGQDIDETTTPLEAGLMWAIAKPLREKGDFIGADALRSAVAKGPVRKRIGLKPEGRQPVRAGAKLFDDNGNPAGQVTSGGFGPSAGHPVAMGYVSTDLAVPGTKILAEVRGNHLPATVHPLPFTPHRYHKG